MELRQKQAIKTALKIISGKWKMIILYVISDGSIRFNQLLREIDGVTQRMLVQELREMEKDGLVNRRVYPEIPPHVEYSISRYGRTLLPLIKEMQIWGAKHLKRNR